MLLDTPIFLLPKSEQYELLTRGMRIEQMANFSSLPERKDDLKQNIHL